MLFIFSKPINCRTKFDYDRWATYGGDQWKAENVLPIFAELENNSLKNVDNMTEFLKYLISHLIFLSPSSLTPSSFPPS
jgi:hypothetical protein